MNISIIQRVSNKYGINLKIGAIVNPTVSRSIALFVLGMVTTLIGCAAGDQVDNLKAQVETPQVNSITPNRLSVGETVIIKGNNFITGGTGFVELRISGSYDGQPVQIVERADSVSADGREIKWTFGPNIPFAPDSNKMAEFVTDGDGQGITVVNVSTTYGKEVAAATVKHNISIDNSILIKNFTPLDDGSCSLTKAGKLSETTEDSAFFLEVEATGLNPATPDNPITFYYALQKDAFDFADPISGLANVDKIDTTSGGFITVINTITDGTTSIIGRSSQETGSYEVNIDNVQATGDMWKLLTRGLPRVPFVNRSFRTQTIKKEEQSFYDTSLNILARDAAGNTARLAQPIRVWKNFSLGVEPPESACISKIESPIDISDCWITGLNDEAAFASTKTITRGRNIEFKNQSGVQISASLPLIDSLKAQATTTFGVEVEDDVSLSITESQTRSNFREPDMAAVVYIQPIQEKRYLPLIQHTVCGFETNVGTAVFTNARRAIVPAKRPVAEGNCTRLPQPPAGTYDAPMIADCF